MYRLFLLLAVAATDVSARQTEAVAPASALHGYVLGRFAYSDAELAKAARYFDLARGQDPGRPALTKRAFDLAVAAGDRARAIELARQLSASGVIDSDVQLVRLADAVLRKDWNAVDKARAGIADAGYAAVVGPIVEAWSLYGRGQADAALARLDPAAFSGFSRSYVAEQRAHMLSATGRWQEAAAAYGELRLGSGAGISLLKQGEADALAQAGDKAGAMKLLDGDEAPMVAARKRLESARRIGPLAPDARRGIGWMAARLASDLSRDKPVPLALMFARLGNFLAPDVPATWLIAGDVMARSDQAEAALAAYAEVPPGDPLFEAAKARRAEVLETLGRDSDAGALLKAATTSTAATADDWTRLGDWHRRSDRFRDSVLAYDKAIALAGDDAGWGLYFLRGSMNERGGDWAAGERDLREALRRSPDEPIVLNYLGYSLLDRGLGTAEATTMIESAAKLRPGDGGIIDSLGWSQYGRRQFAEAIVSLEKAVALEPNDPTITEHLGDALWQVGRRIEARFRWRAASDLGPDAKQKKALAAKLDYGLDAAMAMMAGVPTVN